MLVELDDLAASKKVDCAAKLLVHNVAFGDTGGGGGR